MPPSLPHLSFPFDSEEALQNLQRKWGKCRQKRERAHKIDKCKLPLEAVSPLDLEYRQQENHIFHPKPLPNMCHPRSVGADKTLQNLGDRSPLTLRNPRNLVRNKQTERPFCSVLPSIPAPFCRCERGTRQRTASTTH